MRLIIDYVLSWKNVELDARRIVGVMFWVYNCGTLYCVLDECASFMDARIKSR
jgi:hypothetical protein